MKLRLLIAESDLSLAELFGRFLRRSGYDVNLASNGVEFWAELNSNWPDLLVLDWELPWGGRSSILDRLYMSRSAVNLPIVLTTTEDPSVGSLCHATAKVTACLRKPFRLAELAEAIELASSSLWQFQPGQCARIRSGPCAGEIGQVIATSDDGRCLLEVSSQGPGVYLRLDCDALEPVEGSASMLTAHSYVCNARRTGVSRRDGKKLSEHRGISNRHLTLVTWPKSERGAASDLPGRPPSAGPIG